MDDLIRRLKSAPHLLLIWLAFAIAGVWGFTHFKQPTSQIAEPPVADGQAIEIYQSHSSLSLPSLLESETHLSRFRPLVATDQQITSGDRIHVWIRLPFENRTDQPQDYALEINNRWIDLATLYIPAADGSYVKQQYGEAHLQRKQSSKATHPYFTFSIAPHSSETFYLNLQNPRRLQPAFTIWNDPDLFAQNRLSQDRFIHIYIGLMIGLFFTNLCVFLAFKHEDLIYYLLFLIASAALHLINFNFHLDLFHALLAGSETLIQANLNYYLFSGLLLLTGGLLLLFATEFLEIQRIAPNLFNYTRTFIYTLIALAPITMFGPSHLLGGLLSPLIACLWGASNLIALGLGIFAATHRLPQARYYLPALLLLVIVAWRFNWAMITNQTTTIQILQQWLYASCLEMLLFAFGLLDRFTSLNQQKIAAQKQALDEMHARNALQARFNDELSSTVEARTRSLNDANQQKERLLTYLAHDMRTPLSGVISLSAMLSRAPKNFSVDEVHGYASEIEGSARAVSEQMENLLSWGQLQSNQVQPKRQDYLVADIFEATQRIVHTQAKLRQISLDFSSPDDCYVICDFTTIVAVLRNLLTNAIKFSPSNASIHIEASQQTTQEVRIHVKDTGMGMPQDMVAQINSQQAPSIRKGTQGDTGTGLGLTICQHLLKINNSLLIVDSIEGQSSCFSFTLKQSQP